MLLLHGLLQACCWTPVLNCQLHQQHQWLLGCWVGL
jgi:hypothetical protein